MNGDRGNRHGDSRGYSIEGKGKGKGEVGGGGGGEMRKERSRTPNSRIKLPHSAQNSRVKAVPEPLSAVWILGVPLV